MKVMGINSVMEALKSGNVNKIFVLKDYSNPRIKEIVALAKKKKIPVVYTPQLPKDARGVMAEVSPIKYKDVDTIVDKCVREGSFILFLDSVEDPQNMGAIMRSAEFFGCAGVVIPKRRCVQVNETVAKVSAGAVFHLDIARVENLANTLKKLKKFGITVVGADLDGEPLRNVDLSPPLAIVVGGEDKGLSKPVKKRCDFIAKIEGCGKINSLNLAVAGAIVMFEFRRRLHEG
ncbi:23S rRNA (guanosine(2251)-2'-O)-methyltransferase RlmB [Archaeoglobus sp.]